MMIDNVNDDASSKKENDSSLDWDVIGYGRRVSIREVIWERDDSNYHDDIMMKAGQFRFDL